MVIVSSRVTSRYNILTNPNQSNTDQEILDRIDGLNRNIDYLNSNITSLRMDIPELVRRTVFETYRKPKPYIEAGYKY